VAKTIQDVEKTAGCGQCKTKVECGEERKWVN